MAGLWMLSQVPALVFIGIESLLLWSCVAAIIQYLYLTFEHESGGRRSRFATLWQWVILLFATVITVKFLAPAFNVLEEINQAPIETLRLSAVVLLASGCVLYLYTSYAGALQERLKIRLLTPILYLARIVFAACIATAAALFVFLSANYDYSGRLGELLTGAAGLLAVEPLFQFAGRFYQPRSLRKAPAAVGSSLLLDVLFGSGHGTAGLIKDLEDLAGTKLGEIWILRFLRRMLAPVLFSGLLLGWFSTCFSTIQAGSHGVLVSFGRYGGQPLEPGLHVCLPWPFQQIVSIQTERFREISLGFDKDLSNAVLWTEKHVEGEKNLLVDNGEGLLAINVPIIYRISNPVTYLKTTTDAELALKSIAERKLTQIAATREIFHFMTDERQPIADALKEGIQAEVDRLGLGLEVAFVGLKDIHPPVTVAPAYQKVVSSQEEMEATIDNALAYQARTLPLANAQAQTLVTAAEAEYQRHVLQSTGEAARFASVVPAEKENPALFRLRLKYDLLGETLATPAKTIVGISGKVPPEYILDLRAGVTNTAGSVLP